MFDAGVTTRAAELLSCVRMGVSDVDWYVHAPRVVVKRARWILEPSWACSVCASCALVVMFMCGNVFFYHDLQVFSWGPICALLGLY